VNQSHCIDSISYLGTGKVAIAIFQTLLCLAAQVTVNVRFGHIILYFPLNDSGQLFAIRDIFYCEQNQLGLAVLPHYPPGIEKHPLATNPWEFMLHQKILNLGFLSK
jgi:hypothetical protein